MRWPIRHQILLPFVGVVLLSVAALTLVAAWLAARRSEQQTLARLQDTLETLERANFPLNAAVLQKIHGLSGAQFLALDGKGEVLSSTLTTTGPLPQNLTDAPIRGELSSLAARPPVAIDGTPYYAARLRPGENAGVHSLVVLYPVDRWSRDRRDAALLPLMVGGPALVLTALVALWLAQRFSRRLRRLEMQVAAIAAGDFREIAPGERQDEIRDLVISVNRMAAQLSQMQQTIRQSERTRLLSQLAGGLAHQLRNAVTGARMALQLHQRRCVSEGNDQSLSVALRQLSLTESQVRGLLSLGRGERRPRVPCELSRLVAEIEPLLGPACEHLGVALIVDRSGESHASVSADVEALRAGLLNLALNAIEAAGPGGEVELRVSDEGGQARVDVRDDGPGPPAEIAEALFDPFVTSRAEGVGLGLALARQVAIDHGGTLVWFREEEHTVFRLSLPGVAASLGDRDPPLGRASREMVETSHSRTNS